MDYSLLAAALLDVALFTAAGLAYFQHRQPRLLAWCFLGIAASFLVGAVVKAAAGLVDLAVPLVLLRGVQTLVWAALLMAALAVATQLRKLFLVPAGAAVAAILVLGLPTGAFLVLFLGSYLAALAFFVFYLFSQHAARTSGLFGIGAAVAGIVLQMSGVAADYWFLADVLLLAAFSYYTRHGFAVGEVVPKIELIEAGERPELGAELYRFGYLFVYIVLLNSVVLMASTVLHELGHLFIGQLFGCAASKIVLIDLALTHGLPGPYTELVCPIGIGPVALAVSGFALLVPFALLLASLRAFPEHLLGVTALGLSFVLASMDLSTVSVPEVALIALIAGNLLIAASELLLVQSFFAQRSRPPEERKVSSPLSTVPALEALPRKRGRPRKRPAEPAEPAASGK